jgi:hypothetical protein
MLKRIFTFISILGAIAGIFFLGYRLLSKPSTTEKENPYEYDLNSLQEIDPDLIWYEEVQQIIIPLERLYGVASGYEGGIYVTGDKALMIFNGEGLELERIELVEPARCVAIGERGDVYLGLTDHVEVYDSRGSLEDIWPGLGKYAIITSIAITQEYVFVADAGNGAVLKFNKSGKLLGRIGDRDVERGIQGFFLPSPYFDVAAGSGSSIWAANNGRHSIENYLYDGELRASWGKPSVNIDGFSGCCNPMHFAIMPDGSFVTSEKGLVRVKIHDSHGKFVCAVAGAEQFTQGTVAPDLAVDRLGRIITLDYGSGIVRIFTKK